MYQYEILKLLEQNSQTIDSLKDQLQVSYGQVHGGIIQLEYMKLVDRKPINGFKKRYIYFPLESPQN